MNRRETTLERSAERLVYRTVSYVRYIRCLVPQHVESTGASMQRTCLAEAFVIMRFYHEDEETRHHDCCRRKQ